MSSLLPKPKDTRGQMETKDSQSSLYSTKFYTNWNLTAPWRQSQHSTVTNGQTLEPAGRKDEGKGRCGNERDCRSRQSGSAALGRGKRLRS